MYLLARRWKTFSLNEHKITAPQNIIGLKFGDQSSSKISTQSSYSNVVPPNKTLGFQLASHEDNTSRFDWSTGGYSVIICQNGVEQCSFFHLQIMVMSISIQFGKIMIQSLNTASCTGLFHIFRQLSSQVEHSSYRRRFHYPK